MGSIISKFIIVLLVVAVAISLWNSIVYDPNVGAAFDELMGMLPFVQPFSKIITNVTGYTTSVTPSITSTFVLDLFKLMLMSCVLPLVTRWLTRVFFKIPVSLVGVEEKDAYMNGCGYSVKYTLMQIVTAPVLAFLVSFVAEELFQWLISSVGYLAATFAGLAATVLTAGLSAVLMASATMALGVALMWRFGITLFGGMLKTSVITFFSLAVYFALRNNSSTVGWLISFAVFMIVIDFGLRFMQLAIGTYSAGRG